MFYICRKRGAIGIADIVVEAKDFDDFLTKSDGLEPLMASENSSSVRHYLTSNKMNELVFGAKEPYQPRTYSGY